MLQRKTQCRCRRTLSRHKAGRSALASGSALSFYSSLPFLIISISCFLRVGPSRPPLLLYCRLLLALPHLDTANYSENARNDLNSGFWIDEDSYRSGNGCDSFPCG